MTSQQPIRIGYVPEHYLIPLHLAKSHFSEPVELIPFPSGTGHMITSLRSDEIDVGIGLTEGWVAGLMNAQGQKEKGYSIVGSWVQNPLRWAIVTGRNRDDIDDVEDLKQHRRVGVSRMGSGSHVMAFVLADQKGWLRQGKDTKSEGLVINPLGPFKDLRDGVTGAGGQGATADFFMWEHFTTKPYFDGDKTPLKHIGEIYTPWPSWHIAASTKSFPAPTSDQTLSKLFDCLDRGVDEFNKNPQSAIKRLVQGEFGCQYSEEDANEWLVSAKFFEKTRGVDTATMDGVIKTLEAANVIEPSTEVKDTSGIVGVAREDS
ncbi:hypothetical protein OHC33_005396 [Knufia fluminis]|uniref:Ca3427-like PBP 2 domain-containing protein n=1 Tax=Knufia fluminis TaxID=191047 RepID=A0AAN8IMQ8_9EURO|nr:hypothetical protein OHC33_005396 [Knufia fluminis]